MSYRTTNRRFPGTNAPNARYPIRSSGLRTLLVPLDGSSLAEHALPHALAIARRTGATIRLVHVHAPWDRTDVPGRLYSNQFTDLNQRRQRQMQEYLNEIVRRVGWRDTVKMVTYLSEGERTAEQLSMVAQGADLVVMATHGWGWWRRIWYGSTAEALLRRLSCPMLLVRGYHSPVDLTGDPVVRKVLVPLDGSQLAERILTPAAAIGQVSDAEVTLLHVDNSGQTNSTFVSMGDAHGYLRTTANSLNSRLGQVSTRLLATDASTAQAVLSFATQHEIDLVAVTTRALGGLAGFTRDRIADVVLQQNRMKVLMLRPNETLKEGVLI